MQEIYNFYTNLNANWGMLTMMIIMSAFVGIFHNVIFSSLFKIKLKPYYLFCVLNPLLIVTAGLYHPNLGALIAIVLFVSVFFFGILGMIYAGIQQSFEKHKEQTEFRKGKNLAPIPIWKKIASNVLLLVLFGFILALGVPYAILAVILFVILSSIFKKSNKSKFYSLQRDLPTANIRSVAMGLAEISGSTQSIEKIKAKINNKECIGYHYTIEDISRDSEGKESFSTAFTETVCNSFYVKDDSDQIKVNGDEIELIDFEIDEQYRNSNRRYTQYVLYDNQNVLLIGKASLSTNNELIFEKETIKNVFGIAPLESVKKHNTLRPLLVSASYYFAFWMIIVVYILLVPIKSKGNQFHFGDLNLNSPFTNSKPVHSITDFYDNIYETYNKEKEIIFEEDTITNTENAEEDTLMENNENFEAILEAK